MNDNYIVINGIKHVLVLGRSVIEDCYICSLYQLCKKHENCFCIEIFDKINHHFEIQK